MENGILPSRLINLFSFSKINHNLRSDSGGLVLPKYDTEYFNSGFAVDARGINCHILSEIPSFEIGIIVCG